MSSFTNQNKTSAFSPTNTSKNAISPNNVKKGGSGYPYDSYLTYDQELDPVTGLPVFYDTLGTEPTIINVPKS